MIRPRVTRLFIQAARTTSKTTCQSSLSRHLSSVPVSSLSSKFRNKFDIQYTKPLPKESLINLGGPVFTPVPLSERTLEFELRQTELQETKLGSKGSTRLRRGGYLPCLIYGGGPKVDNPDVPVTIPTKVVEKLIRTFGQHLENTVFKILIREHPGQHVFVVPRQLQTHPVSDEVLTLNFLRLVGKNANKRKQKHKLDVSIPIEYIEQDLSPAIKRGGFVNRTRWKLPCQIDPDLLISAPFDAEWQATNDAGYDVATGMTTTTDIMLKREIPLFFEVSVAGFEVRDRIRVSNIGMSEGVEPHPTKSKHDVIVGNVRGKTVVTMAEGGEIDGDEIAF